MRRFLPQAYELFLALRFLLGKKSSNYISFVSWASILAMQLGVMTLIIVLSVMNGFRTIIEQMYVSADAEIQVLAEPGKHPDWLQIRQIVAAQPAVTHIASYLERQGLMLNGAYANPLLVRGVLPQEQAPMLKLSEGDAQQIFAPLIAGRRAVLPGSEIARAYHLQNGSQITLMLPKIGGGSVLPDITNFTVAGAFAAQDMRANSELLYSHLNDLQQTLNLPPDMLTGLQVAIRARELAPQVAAALRKALPASVRVVDWQMRNASQYKAIKFEKLMMTIMLSMIVLISGFNIVTTSVMTVNAKRSEIAILRTMGASSAAIARIFIGSGVILGISGVVFGVGSGVLIAPRIGDLLAWFERHFGFQTFDPAVMAIVQVPSQLEWQDVVWVAMLAFVTAVLSTLYPALRAGAVQPAQALHYE